MRRYRIVAVVLTVIALVLAGRLPAEADALVSISNPSLNPVTWGTDFTVTGTTAAPETAVVVHLHPVGTAPDTDVPVTSDSTGGWSTTHVLDTDYEVQATTTGGGSSNSVVFTTQGATPATPTIDQSDTTQVPQGDPFTVSGSATPGSTVEVHYHRADAVTGVEVVRTVTTDSAGHWSRAAVLDVDYTVYATPEGVSDPSRTVTFTSVGTVPLTPTLDQAASTIVAPRAVFTVSGSARPNTTVVVRYHRADAAAGVLILRPVPVDAGGRWSRDAVLDVDYQVSAVAEAGGAPSRTVTFTSKGAPLQTPTLANHDTYVVPGRTFTVRGTASPYSTVAVRYHRAGTAASDYSIVRYVSADAAGNWYRTATLDIDYRVYASTTDNVQRTMSVLFTGTPTITSPLTSTIARGATFTVRGLAALGAPVVLHYHRAGTATSDYSIVRTVYADNAGNWSRSSVLDVDYRVYATMGAGTGRSATASYAAPVPPPPPPAEIGVTKDSYVPFYDTTVGVQFAAWHDNSSSIYTWDLPKAGYRYTSIKVCMRNRGPGTWDAYGFDFHLKTSANYVYEDTYTTTTDGPDFGQSNMRVNELTCGWVTFEVPTSANPTTLIFDTTYSGTVPLDWRTP